MKKILFLLGFIAVLAAGCNGGDVMDVVFSQLDNPDGDTSNEFYWKERGIDPDKVHEFAQYIQKEIHVSENEIVIELTTDNEDLLAVCSIHKRSVSAVCVCSFAKPK
jgi:hypothetical protein